MTETITETVTQPATTSAQATRYAPGVTTLTSEIDHVVLPVSGTIPHWLAGTLLRNGPARFEAGRTSYRHWFDGQAMLHSFAIGDGAVVYTNRYVDTPSSRAAASGRIAYAEFATDPCQSSFTKLFQQFRPTARNAVNPNVGVARIGGQTVAITETPLAVAFDPDTLETIGVAGYQDDLDGQLTTAHPHQDPATGDLVNYLLKFGKKSHYQIYRMAAESKERRLIGRIPVDRPGYMHSFAITEHYVVLVEFPLTVNPLSLLFARKPFIDNYRWDPTQPTRFIVMDSRDGDVRGVYKTDAFFAFHHINAFEDGGELVLDICSYEDASVIDALRLDALRRSGAEVPSAHPTRYRLDLASGTIASHRLAAAPMELPRIAYSQVNGRPYRYAYGIGSDGGAERFATGLVKLDTHTGETLVWSQAGCFTGEPVFVAEPGGSGEDQGVVLSVVLDSATGASRLLILDAQSFEEVARAEVPHAIPFGFHGSFSRRRSGG